MPETTTTTTLNPAAHTVLQRLDPHRAATARQIAQDSGLGRSTVTKALALLESAGLARREQANAHEGGVRVADSWFAPSPTGAEHEASPAPAPRSTATPGADASDAEPADTVHEMPETKSVGAMPETPDGADMPTAPLPSATAQAQAARVRLGKGELRAKIAAHLAAHPEASFTPSALAKVLGNSAGAILNALDTLAATGHAVQTSDKPRAFRHAEPAASAG